MRLFSIAFLLACLSIEVSEARAESVGQVAGRVLDQTGAALPGVVIDLVAGAHELTTQTNDGGHYRFEDVPAGKAELTFRMLNFNVVTRRVTVDGSASLVSDVVLTLALRADVVVTGRATFRDLADIANSAESLIGLASAASQGAITAAHFETRPMVRPADVLETVPGMVTSQHSGLGKANQYYLRGFNLDHGTDFATTVAGVPVNTPTGAHSHGYTDLSFLVPELVSGIQYKKGPYYADEGDFSAAGSATINYVNYLARPLAKASWGNAGWRRVLGAASPRVGGGHLLAALEFNADEGPWVRSDEFQKVNTMLRYSRGDNRNGFSLTGTTYHADWHATDQVPRRAVDSGLISRFGTLDSTDGGRATRTSIATEFQRSTGPSAIRGTAYALQNELTLFSNFTYFLEDPVNGDQFEQSERRRAVGGRLAYRRLGHVVGRHAEHAVGVEVQRDWLDPVGLYRTAARRRLSTTREDVVDQTMAGAYVQSEIEWARVFRTSFGLRADVYQFDVTSDNRSNSGQGSDALLSPKFTAALQPWNGTELYVNAGMGFHSNDARGGVTTVDPASGEPVDPVTPLVRATGAEFGVRTVTTRGLHSTVALWYLDLDSELLFVGDAGTVEPGRPSRRVGLEWSNYLRLLPWLTFDADIAFTRARFRDADLAGQRIPGALDRVISAGVSVEPRQPIFGSLRMRHFGPRPLVEDASVFSRSTTLWNGEAGYRLSDRARLVMEVLNIFDTEVADIDYFYVSRLRGEPAEGVADTHTHPSLPRSARVSLQVSF